MKNLLILFLCIFLNLGFSQDNSNAELLLNKVGNTTFGSNARTGSTWSQTTIGNSTFGTASDGGSWSSTRIGNTTFGTDSKGNSFTCIGQSCY